MRLGQAKVHVGTSGINFSKSDLMAWAIGKELENLPFSARTGMVALSYSWLKGIVPTSVESERMFSTVGIIVTKVLSSLSDEAVDAPCFLKSSTLASDLCDQNMLLVRLQYVGAYVYETDSKYV